MAVSKEVKAWCSRRPDNGSCNGSSDRTKRTTPDDGAGERTRPQFEGPVCTEVVGADPVSHGTSPPTSSPTGGMARSPATPPKGEGTTKQPGPEAAKADPRDIALPGVLLTATAAKIAGGAPSTTGTRPCFWPNGPTRDPNSGSGICSTTGRIDTATSTSRRWRFSASHTMTLANWRCVARRT